MAINTYPLEEFCVLLVTYELAAAIILQDAVEGNKYELPDGITAELDKGRTPWEIASDTNLIELLVEEDLASISDAFDIIQESGESDTVYCSEFTGEANVPTEFLKYHAQNGMVNHVALDDRPAALGTETLHFDSAYVACLIPLNKPELLKQAYASTDDLIQEYKNRLGDLVGPDVPIEKLIRNLSGVYNC